MWVLDKNPFKKRTIEGFYVKKTRSIFSKNGHERSECQVCEDERQNIKDIHGFLHLKNAKAFLVKIGMANPSASQASFDEEITDDAKNFEWRVGDIREKLWIFVLIQNMHLHIVFHYRFSQMPSKLGVQLLY